MLAELDTAPNSTTDLVKFRERVVDPASVPALLTTPQYLGTLAAVRCLGTRGVPIVVGADNLFAPAVWSRWTASRMAAPSVAEGPSQLLDWLLRVGRDRPGMVLYPTCDDLAWLISRHADPLSQHFRLFAPSVSAIEALLDKSLLHATCVALAVPTPRTWLPKSASEAGALVSQLGRMLVKPRTQMFFGGGKGEIVSDPTTAMALFQSYADVGYPRELAARLPNLTFPLLQEYIATGTNATYSISGFIDREGRVISVRASKKVTQTPTHIGVGLLFEAAEVDPVALRNIERICKHVGYFGVFEVEFVRSGDALLLVDFNPRYFGQMEFDIARDSALPWLVHLAALGAPDEVLSTAVRGEPQRPLTHYLDRVGLGWRIATALASGRLGPLPELRRALADNAAPTVDATWRKDDPSPAAAAAASRIWGVFRHPRSFLKSILRFDDLHR